MGLKSQMALHDSCMQVLAAQDLDPFATAMSGYYLGKSALKAYRIMLFRQVQGVQNYCLLGGQASWP